MGVSLVFENKSIKTDVSGINSGAYFSLDAFAEIMLAMMYCIRIERREAQVTQFKFDIPPKGRLQFGNMCLLRKVTLLLEALLKSVVAVGPVRS